MKTILIIEDDPKHLQDAKEFFSKINDISVVYRKSYEPFNSITRNNTPHLSDNFKNYDGVISDIYFPSEPGGETQPIGVSVMFQCKMLDIPCVLCTSGYHHGDYYQWISEMQTGLKEGGWKEIPRMIDSADAREVGVVRLKEKGEKGEEVPTKCWAKAWKELQKHF